MASGGGTFNGFIGGALAGYNFLLSNQLMLGIEADVGVSNAHGNGIASTDSYMYDLNAMPTFALFSAFRLAARGFSWPPEPLSPMFISAKSRPGTTPYLHRLDGCVGVDAPLGTHVRAPGTSL